MSIAEVQVAAEIETFAYKDHLYSVALYQIKGYPLGAAGAFIVLIMILMALFAELIAPFDPELNSTFCHTYEVNKQLISISHN